MSTQNLHAAYGVSERLEANDNIDEAVAELRINGYAVLESGLSRDFLDTLKGDLDRVYSRQVQEMGGEDVLRRIHDTDIARCMLSYESNFLAVATTEPLMKLAARVLGSEFVLMQQNGIINKPDRENYQAKWHRDLPHQHWTSSKPLAINALLCLDDFTLENGATFVLPGTHHVPEFPTDMFVSRFEKQIAAPAGSYLVLDAMLYHRGGTNSSANARRAVNHVIGLPFMAQQVDIPSALASTGMPEPQDASIRKYLGYRWAPAESAIGWRLARI
ncbi:phytanoyl-CoA dioxygenase family protein [Paraburkholderia phenazinium]|jgi:ectoine hydroxylase-related dioxygenase (phytanoyl-CoA dioxygenase family)|uniref:Ectoine hydroxylase-related dioxygenase, phytanoyl-CoA dioxygenase (PhyH) family n=1 Tax=Paraburkholderia phenazinium TaxID=60549 RepID=A0A1G8HZA1_9BURK|nr:phytanoyl-CoA dioxygenase family protein [Paraburkholderia phenazinium]SDI11831.1 Ectoine hydroxylase-related dioxygenase, phytanoyl-CoA dioxygenase (PhyH) family [Paraburkholderia phenazinium]